MRRYCLCTCSCRQHACCVWNLCAGCEHRYGVVPRSSHAAALAAGWASRNVKSFTCQQCGPNQVPFLPGSNLLAAWDGAKWSFRCHDSNDSSSGSSFGSSSSNDQAGGEPPATSSILVGTVVPEEIGHLPAAARTRPRVSTASAGDVEVWYKEGIRAQAADGSVTTVSHKSYTYAPWWPGQCIDCALVGGTADPTGTFCGERALATGGRLLDVVMLLLCCSHTTSLSSWHHCDG